MATYLNTAHTDRMGNPIAGVWSDMRARFSRHRVYTRTLNELRSLNDRELRDLGLSRSNLRAVAYDSAYGKS